MGLGVVLFAFTGLVFVSGLVKCGMGGVAAILSTLTIGALTMVGALAVTYADFPMSNTAATAVPFVVLGLMWWFIWTVFGD